MTELPEHPPILSSRWSKARLQYDLACAMRRAATEFLSADESFLFMPTDVDTPPELPDPSTIYTFELVEEFLSRKGNVLFPWADSLDDMFELFKAAVISRRN